MKRVIITGARAPVALHLARLFHQAGHHVVLADTFRTPIAAATRFKAAYVQLPPPRRNVALYAEAVRRLVDRTGPDLVIPTCEEVFYLAAIRDLHGVALPLFAPSFASLGLVHDKARFAARAGGFGADPPATIRLDSLADAEALPDPSRLVFKPVWTRFGARVRLRPSPAALASIRPTLTDPWVAQAFLPGAELCAYAIAHGGRLTAFQAYSPLYRAGLGAGIAFAPLEDAVATDFARGIIAALDWTGQIAFDFRRDEAGALHVIECNPRATSGAHFFAAGDGLPAAMLTGASAAPSLRDPMTLPLAMLTYGLRDAVATGRVRAWARDCARMRDVAAWPGDRNMLGPQLRALAEIAARALRERTSLIEASARDIEWNGQQMI